MIKFKTLLANFVLSFLISLISFSQIKQDFDILHYEIYVDLYNGLVQRNGFYNGYTKIKFVANKNLNELNIHASSTILKIDSVIWANNRLNFQRDSDVLKIIFPRTISQSETTIVAIYFRRESSINKGFYFYRSDAFSPNLPSDIAYTMTEPSDSRYWFPCYDEPWDKATVDVIVKVKGNFLVASNGLLIRDEKINQNERIFHWSSKYPMSTYLICFATSEYITFSYWYRKVSNPNDSIEIKYYVWREDSIKAVNAFKNVVDMMRFFSTKFGEYPFEKYGMVAVYPFSYGGMEHQTMTTIHRNWLSGSYEGGIAHELAHQWWGDLVTCENWGEIWLNEGFASYGDALYTEYKYGFESFKSKLQSWARSYFSEDSLIRYPIYNPPASKLFGTAVYFKGAWVLHMLRNLIGDSAFFKVLREWGRRYAYSTGTTQKFIQVINDITGGDYNWFFDQWVYDSGYPVLTFEISSIDYGASNLVNLSLRVKQVQKNARIFKLPIEFKFESQNLDTTLTFWNYTADTTYKISLNYAEPVGSIKVQIDPNEKILKKVISSTLSEVVIQREFEFNLYQNYPNPFNASTKISFEVSGKGKIYDCELKVFDILGREVSIIYDGKVVPGRYSVYFNAEGLSSGVYFYELRVFENGKLLYRGSRKMILTK